MIAAVCHRFIAPALNRPACQHNKHVSCQSTTASRKSLKKSPNCHESTMAVLRLGCLEVEGDETRMVDSSSEPPRKQATRKAPSHADYRKNPALPRYTRPRPFTFFICLMMIPILPATRSTENPFKDFPGIRAAYLPEGRNIYCKIYR